MASLSCLSIFEAGAFGSNPGNVVIPTVETPFPMSAQFVPPAANLIITTTTPTVEGTFAQELVPASANLVLTTTAPTVQHNAALSPAADDLVLSTTAPDIAAPSFTPADLGNVVIWLRGDDLTGADTDPISTWPDASGNSNDATQSGSKPTVMAANLNGMNVALFVEASAQFMNLPNVLTGLTQASQFFVTRTTDTNPSQGPVSKLGSQTGANENNHYPSSNGAVHDDFGSTVRKSTGITNQSVYHIGNMNSKSADWTFYQNGTLVFSTATNTVGWRTTPNIGKGTRPGFEAYFGGRLAEFIILSQYLSQSDREKVEGYLAHKWDIASVLDAGHPYKNSPP